MERTVLLTNWTISFKYGFLLLRGNVSGHSRMSDGMRIRTSPLVSFEEEGMELVAETENTTYRLSKKGVCLFQRTPRKYAKNLLVQWESVLSNTPAALRGAWIYYAAIHILSECQDFQSLDRSKLMESHNEILSLCGEDGIKLVQELADIGTQVQMEREVEDKQVKDMITQSEDYFIDMGINGEYLFNYALFMGGDKQVHSVSEPSVHIGMFQDSVLIRGDESRGYLLRYFPYKHSRLEFYDWPEEPNARVWIRNSGSESLEMSMKWGCTFILGSGETRLFRHGDEEGAVDNNSEPGIDLYDVMHASIYMKNSEQSNGG